MLRGQLFEPEALRLLSRGGVFSIRRLCSSSETRAVDGEQGDRLHLMPSEQVMFAGVEQLDLLRAATSSADDVLYVPKSKSFCAVDAILPGKALANATTSAAHKPIVLVGKTGRQSAEHGSTVGLFQVVQTLRMQAAQGPIRFYWLLPEDVFPHATRARPFSVDGKVLRLQDMPDALADVARRVEQYALRVPLQPTSDGSAPAAELGPATTADMLARDAHDAVLPR